MNWNFSQMADAFSKDQKSRLLLKGKWGIERETQRVTPSGDLALTDHPAVFGDKMKNAKITTDFSESQLELITPPFPAIEETLASLLEIQAEAEKGLEGELLWPLSMPPRLPGEESIPIARFSDSKEGREKETYRRGLALRYGKKMQMISGIHYNFSFAEELLDYLHTLSARGKEKRDFIDRLYFSLARNFLRYRWLLVYLLGASPSADATYDPVLSRELKTVGKCCPECCCKKSSYRKYATSLRVSRFGYSNSIQRKYTVSFNSLEEYIGGIRRLMATKSRRYEKLGLEKNGLQMQLNGYVLQKESEFYSSIRVKQNPREGETQLDALEKRGVKYVEVRILDLNPFETAGIGLEQLYFLQVFMLFCLFEESRPITEEEEEKMNKNHHLAALSGRKPELELYADDGTRKKLKTWGEEIFQKLAAIAQLMDHGIGKELYAGTVEIQHEKLMDPSLLPSALVDQEMREYCESHLAFGIRHAKRNTTNRYYLVHGRSLWKNHKEVLVK